MKNTPEDNPPAGDPKVDWWCSANGYQKEGIPFYTHVTVSARTEEEARRLAQERLPAFTITAVCKMTDLRA